MPKKPSPPSASTLKARRRRVPHFEDEPIQWHRNSSKHDKCPWCGLPEIVYFSKSERSCDACDVLLRLSEFKSGKAWYEAKLDGFQTHYGGPPNYKIIVPDDAYEPYNMFTAQKASHDGVARLHLKHGFNEIQVRWHRDGLLPERKNGKRMMAAGSDFWHWLLPYRAKELWVPNDPLNAMEVLARAATDDPVFAIMRG